MSILIKDIIALSKYACAAGGPIIAEQSVDPIISPEDEKLAHEIAQKSGGRIGGSFLVHGVHANDIDVFMTSAQFANIADWLYKQNIYPDVNDAGGSLYEEDGGYALDGVYNIGRVQIILVKPHFVDAYQKAASIMSKDPGQFHNKADRIALHRILRYLEQQE